MEEKTIGIGDSLRYGWHVMKQNFWFFAGMLVVYYFVLFVISILMEFLLADNVALYLAGNIVYYILSTLLGIGLLQITLAFCDGKKPPLSLLFTDGGKYLWRTIGAYILYMLIVFGGFILLIIPGIIWMLKFSQAFYLIVDQDMGIMDSLKKSAEITAGVKWELLGLSILSTLINILGIIAFGIGLFATVPTTMMAYTYVYRRLAGKTPKLAKPKAA